MYQGERPQGLFNPERKYNSHSSVGGYFSGRNNNNINFGGNFPVHNAQGWVNNNMNLFSNNYFSNNSNGSGNYNSGMGKLTPNSSNCNNNNIFLASNKKNSSNSSLRYNDTDYSSRDEVLNFNNFGNLNNTFNNNNDFVNFSYGSRTNLCQIENSMANLSIGSNHGSQLGSTHGTNSLTSSLGNLSGLNKPKKKGFSTGAVSHNYQNNVKKNFNPKQKKVNIGNNLRERDDEEEDLETFLEELEGDLHTFICSQKGSR